MASPPGRWLAAWNLSWLAVDLTLAVWFISQGHWLAASLEACAMAVVLVVTRRTVRSWPPEDPSEPDVRN